jgi:hypothetical protein
MSAQENRIAEIRSAIEAENISYGEIAELQDTAAESPELFADDPLLAEWAGIPEEKWRQGMKPATHTSAPWSVDYEGPAHLSIEDSAGRVLAFCNLQNENGDEDEANARLIAAAPDLLRTLKNAREWLDELAGLLQDGALDAAEDWAGANAVSVDSSLAEAIAKAEGAQ